MEEQLRGANIPDGSVYFLFLTMTMMLSTMLPIHSHVYDGWIKLDNQIFLLPFLAHLTSSVYVVNQQMKLRLEHVSVFWLTHINLYYCLISIPIVAELGISSFYLVTIDNLNATVSIGGEICKLEQTCRGTTMNF
jgi:hypothetical protein